MPQYNMTATQLQILTSWLFEDGGYLDAARRSGDLQSARAALAATPGLDVYNWIRTNTKAPATVQSDWDECGMVWWIRSHDQVNITNPTKPPETAAYIAKLQTWDSQINAGFGRVPQANRDSSTVPITAENGTVTTMPAGQHLSQQQQIISKVLGVLV